MEGPYQGRKYYEQLNLINPNEQTVEMAKRTLSAICHATDQMQIKDSEQLHFKPLMMVVTIQPPKNGNGERNQVRFHPLEQAPVRTAPKPASSPPQPATQTNAAVPARNTSAPWNSRQTNG